MRFGSMSVLAQVAALVVFAVVATITVIVVTVITAPPPRPAGFTIAAAADALAGRPAQTSDGRALHRRLSDQPEVLEVESGPLEIAIRGALAQRLGQPIGVVRVRMAPERRPPFDRRSDPDRPEDGRGQGVSIQRTESFVFTHRMPEGGAAPMAPQTHAAIIAQVGRALEGSPPGGEAGISILRREGGPEARFTIQADRLTFAPFVASVRQPDGRWATVEPPRGLIDPWQARLLRALAITLLLVAPVVWLMARRLTRPIRVFADAARRLGADPEAEPLTPSGPSEVRVAIAAFNDMQGAIRQHVRQRTQTIAAIAHDLRTPLTRLRFRAEQAPEGLRDKMAADVEEMDALIGQAMAFVRGEAQTERCERLDLAALAASCAAGFAETGAAVTFEGGEPMWVAGDPAALKRAVANLIDNAVKFAGRARVSTSSSEGRAVVAVSDDGPGLPEAELEAVFEPFHRGERSRNRQTGGAGLGLAVARQAARAAGGDVILAVKPSGGLIARLDLPLIGPLLSDAKPRTAP